MQSLMGYEETRFGAFEDLWDLKLRAACKKLSGDCTPEPGPLPGHVFPRKFLRKAQPKGPLTVFGFDYFADETKELERSNAAAS